MASFVLYLVIAALGLQNRFKTKGSYAYRVTIAYIIFALCSSFGFLSSIVCSLIGKRGEINYSVGVFTQFMVKHFLGITATVEGKEHLIKGKEGLAIYVVNHQTFMDILFISFIMPTRTSMVAKKVIQYYPILGWFMTLSKAIFLDRSNRDGAIKQAKKAAQDIHEKNQCVFIFPEGTRSNSYTNTLLPFKKGAFYMATQAQVPVIPIVLCNYREIFNAKKKHFTSGNLRIRVLPPVLTKDLPENSESIQELTDNVREQMLTALKEISPADEKLE